MMFSFQNDIDATCHVSYTHSRWRSFWKTYWNMTNSSGLSRDPYAVTIVAWRSPLKSVGLLEHIFS
jgi:hypothetical protein